MRIALLGFVLLLAGVARTSAAVYFVDYVGGSDVNTGTEPGRPWKHCPGDPAAVGAAAVVVLGPGDTVHFKGGVEYVLTAATGIRLDWNGAEGDRLTYDGNSDGSWGVGRAVLTDHRGANAITVFSTSSARHHLTFRGFDFFAVGGAAALPPDTGSVVSPRFGGGIALLGGADAILIEDCAFRELGYWQNQRPLAAESLAGAGITTAGRVQVTISRCTFARMAMGCDLSGTNDFSQVNLDQCVFGEALVWPLNLPPSFGAASVLALEVAATTIPAPSAFYGSEWNGYGAGPFRTEHSVVLGETVVFAASAVASPAASFQWYKDGVPLSGATGSRLDLGPAEEIDAGTYSAVATNSGGSASSNSIVLVVTGAPASLPSSGVPPSGGDASTSPAEIAVAPAITQQPVSQGVTTGSSVNFIVVATGTPESSYQWQKNGLPIAGATSTMLTFPAVTLNDAANYRVVVANPAGVVTSTVATLTVFEPPSTPGPTPPPVIFEFFAIKHAQYRATATFKVPGNSVRRVLLRALGPTFAALGGAGAMEDPKFDLFLGGSGIAFTNDNWGGSPELSLASNQAGAVPFVSPASADAALLVTLPPGQYIVAVSGVNGSIGDVLLEVYLLP